MEKQNFFIDLHDRGDFIPSGTVKFLVKNTDLLFVIQEWMPEKQAYMAIREEYLKKNQISGKKLANEVLDTLESIKTDIVIKDGIMSLSKGRGVQTENGDFGASVLMFQDELMRAADKLAPRDKEIVVLPASRNQIVMEVANRPLIEYNDVMKKINAKQSKSNILVDHCFALDRRTGEIYLPKWM